MQPIRYHNNKTFIPEKVIYQNEETRTTVYAVQDKDLGRTVILKEMYYENAQQKEQILREIKGQVLLEKHTDSTPSVYNVFVTTQSVCIEMQQMTGKSLREIITEHASQTKSKEWYQENYKLFFMLCETVAELHKIPSFVHKDLKPENVIVNRERNRIYIIDFSISGPGVSKGIGTPAYMAPEQQRNVGKYSVSQATDVFALGQIGIEMFRGSPLEYGEELVIDPSPLKNSWMQEVDISDIGVNFYPNLGVMLSKAIAMNPEDRYPNARAMVSALRAGKGGKRGKR